VATGDAEGLGLLVASTAPGSGEPEGAGRGEPAEGDPAETVGDGSGAPAGILPGEATGDCWIVVRVPATEPRAPSTAHDTAMTTSPRTAIERARGPRGCGDDWISGIAGQPEHLTSGRSTAGSAPQQ
jgi:hypothetical protein